MKNNSTQVIKQNKNITAIIKKLKEVHINFWRLYNLPFQLDSIYLAILI